MELGREEPATLLLRMLLYSPFRAQQQRFAIRTGAPPKASNSQLIISDTTLHLAIDHSGPGRKIDLVLAALHAEDSAFTGLVEGAVVGANINPGPASCAPIGRVGHLHQGDKDVPLYMVEIIQHACYLVLSLLWSSYPLA